MGLSLKGRLIIGATLLILISTLAILGWQAVNQSKSSNKPAAQTHDVVLFDSKVQQVLKAGDILKGKGIADAKVTVSITPDGDSKDVIVDKDSNWTYQIPETIAPKNYNLTVVIKDIANTIASIKTYPIKITSGSSSLQSQDETIAYIVGYILPKNVSSYT